MLSEKTKPILYIIVNNHFDLTWRRCWKRPFSYQGKTFVSYTDLEAYYLLDNLTLAERYSDYRFEAESVQIVRQFIERYPEKLSALQQLAREGRFAVTGGGEAIVDANMITGESLVRNFVDGLLWVEQTFGQKTRLAVRNDAFGNSAQLPQILRGVEINWATGMCYSPAEGLYWRGLDGSTVLHKTLPVAGSGGGNRKYMPCRSCAGTGQVNDGVCPGCHGRGIDPSLRASLPSLTNLEGLAGFGAGLIQLAPEELLPNMGLPDWAEKMRAEYDVRFALEEDVLPHLKPWLDAVDNPPADCLHPSIELNPNNSGCLVSRIKTKQIVRRQEYDLLAVEALSTMAALKGAAYPTAQLKQIRQDQYFTMFHDSITATHIDAAYNELGDLYQQVDNGIMNARIAALGYLLCSDDDSHLISVINPTGQPITSVCSTVLPSQAASSALIDEAGQAAAIISTQKSTEQKFTVEFLAESVPPFSTRQYQVISTSTQPAAAEPLSQPVLENKRFRIQADAHGLVSVFDKTLGREILVSGEYRPGEFILEHDEGSPWATLSPDMTRTPLATYTHLVCTEKVGGVQRLIYALNTPREMGLSGGCLNATLTISLIDGLDRIDFKAHAIWSAFNQRLRVAMPIPSEGSKTGAVHRYEVPYGVVTRQPYSPGFRWDGANGDWPAINWAGVEMPKFSVALLNKGTPSYQIETVGNSEVILLSLLRSPTVPTYLHEPEFYSMTDYDGMRDEGEHDFEYAIRAYSQPLLESSVVLDAEAYNAHLVVVEGSTDLPNMPTLQSDVARVTAVKWAEAADGLILRLVEYRGRGGTATINLPFPVKTAAMVNLLERQPMDLPILNQTVQIRLRPWEIASLKLKM